MVRKKQASKKTTGQKKPVKGATEMTGKQERKKKATNLPKTTKRFHIVGIGASAGGLEAFEKFFRNMAPDSGMAFVLVPHLDPTHASLMPELIQKSSKMKVIQITDGTKVGPNRIYIVPPNHDLAILNRTLQLMEPIVARGPRMPIDFFLRSLAQDQKENAIGIILSGMGTDGTIGLRTIKGELGLTMVQSPDSAKFEGMPSSAIATDIVDYVLPPDMMPAQLMAYAEHAAKKATSELALTKLPDALQKIFILLRTHTGHDFSGYKQNTICRRIERRMNIHQIEKIPAYVRYLQENPLEIETLFKELLIGVTNFFRDREAFEALKDKALLPLLKGKDGDDPVRVWIPGCSSGEEAYSVAIILQECMDKLEKHFGAQVFATDIDSDAVEKARAGVYPQSISADVSPDRLKKFFVRKDTFYGINKLIRNMLVFAPQDVIKDPPFTKLDLICCRNLLIYMDTKLQKQLLPLFHYCLRSGGTLFLGTSETIGGFSDEFSTIDKKWKIYRRKETGVQKPVLVDFRTPLPREDVREIPARLPTELTVAQLAEKALLSSFAPPSLIINEKGEVLYIHGRTGKYLEPAPGEATLHIHEMAREGLKLELAAAIRKVAAQKKGVIHKGLQVKANGGATTVDLIVKPLERFNGPPGLMMVSFEAVEPEPVKGTKSKRGGEKPEKLARIREIERALQYTKEHLETTIEELETSNEELKSTNEELQSTNEELQSTNEELETSKEEEQSMNEELSTVNAELQNKLDELREVNDDLKNLLDRIDLPIIFLDNDLHIRRFSSNANAVINVIHSDIGRPISHIASKLKDVDLREMAEAVLKDLMPREKEVQSIKREWYSMRVTPYRTTENVIDGVVITLNEAQARLRRLAAILMDSNDAITEQDFEGNILAWNRGAEKMYGYKEAEALKMSIFDMVPKEHHRETREFMKRIKRGEAVVSFKTKRMAKHGQVLDIWMTATKLTDDKGDPIQMATTERDLAWLATEN